MVQSPDTAGAAGPAAYNRGLEPDPYDQLDTFSCLHVPLRARAHSIGRPPDRKPLR